MPRDYSRMFCSEFEGSKSTSGGPQWMLREEKGQYLKQSGQSRGERQSTRSRRALDEATQVMLHDSKLTWQDPITLDEAFVVFDNFYPLLST